MIKSQSFFKPLRCWFGSVPHGHRTDGLGQDSCKFIHRIRGPHSLAPSLLSLLPPVPCRTVAYKTRKRETSLSLPCEDMVRRRLWVRQEDSAHKSLTTLASWSGTLSFWNCQQIPVFCLSSRSAVFFLQPVQAKTVTQLSRRHREGLNQTWLRTLRGLRSSCRACDAPLTCFSAWFWVWTH